MQCCFRAQCNKYGNICHLNLCALLLTFYLLSYVMSELNAKLKDLVNEKASLLTVIKIIQSYGESSGNVG